MARQVTVIKIKNKSFFSLSLKSLALPKMNETLTPVKQDSTLPHGSHRTDASIPGASSVPLETGVKSNAPVEISTKKEKAVQKRTASVRVSAKKRTIQTRSFSNSETETDTDTDRDSVLDNTGRLGCLPVSKMKKIDVFSVVKEIENRRVLIATLSNLNTQSQIITMIIENTNAEWAEVKKARK